MNEKQYVAVLEFIESDVSKIQALCSMTMNTADNEVNPDIQTIFYIIADYAESIKKKSISALQSSNVAVD